MSISSIFVFIMFAANIFGFAAIPWLWVFMPWIISVGLCAVFSLGVLMLGAVLSVKKYG